MTIIHKKVWPEYFEKIISGKKKFELRLADFEVNEDDILVLKEWDKDKKEYTGRKIEVVATYIFKTKGQTFWSPEEVEKYSFQIIQFEPKNQTTTNNEKKLIIFQEVARALNRANIIPILFGSLGLYKAINKLERRINDIDILVPDEFVKEKWNELNGTMKQLDFILKDEGEHEFERDGELVAFGKTNDLINLARVYPKDLEVIEENDAKFKKLSPEQYLMCYKYMLRDDYRQEKRGNADKEKIKLIEDYLKLNKNM